MQPRMAAVMTITPITRFMRMMVFLLKRARILLTAAVRVNHQSKAPKAMANPPNVRSM